MTQSIASVFIIDDHPAVRDALAEMLSVLGYQVATYESAETFLAAVPNVRIGCIVADVRMPGMDGIELVGELAVRGISLPVVLISGHADVPMAVAALKAGAQDFIEKPVDDALLLAAINRSLAQSHDQISKEQVLAELRQRYATLSPRETEVMGLVVEGMTSQAIALKLRISPRTVESYRLQIMDKMGADSVPILVRQAIRLDGLPL